ncbi:hypothetical protein MTR_3g014335 [Medicago truncatula]|uniref:Uncharacterized protein n=1 Tax=Medicago truncatula TaxID=3880 RepID=A0A072UTQ4_MEDTR|nr:hypothetical protein MTR_3g014335 [Medicago truncatula]
MDGLKVVEYFNWTLEQREMCTCRHSDAQLGGQCIIICRSRSSNFGHPSYSPYKKLEPDIPLLHI